MRFKVGQEVVCVVPCNGWYKITGLTWLQKLGLKSKKVRGPGKNEIVTVAGYATPDQIILAEYLYFDGVTISYIEGAFEPIADISELEEILEQDSTHP